MTDEPRWDLINRIPDDMLIYSTDEGHEQWTWAQWRAALGHPYAEGHGFCKTCGAGGPCSLQAFHDALIMSTVRELAAMDALFSRRSMVPRTIDGKKRLHMTAMRRKILRVLLDAKDPVTAYSVGDAVGITPQAASVTLRRLEDHGWISAEKVARRGMTRHFSLVPHVRSHVTLLVEEGED